MTAEINNPLKHILIIRFSSIGDIVLCSPVLRALNKAYPEAQIDVLTKPNFAMVWQGNPYVNRILVWANSDDTKIWKQQPYDLIVDLHGNMRSATVKLIRWDCPSIRFDKQNWRKFLLVRTKNIRFAASPINHRYAKLIYSLGIEKEEAGLDFFNLEAVPEETKLPSAYHVLVLGGSYATKQIPTLKILDFFATLEANISFVLLGGDKEMQAADIIQKQFPDTVINLCGTLRLGQSAEVISQSRVVVTGDTGLAHIAAALGKPILWIWGSTSPELGMQSPVKSAGAALISMEVGGLSCRPCSKLGFHECPQKHFDCMNHDPNLWRQNLEKLNASI